MSPYRRPRRYRDAPAAPVWGIVVAMLGGLGLRLRARRLRRQVVARDPVEAAAPSALPVYDPAMLHGEHGRELLVRVFAEHGPTRDTSC